MAQLIDIALVTGIVGVALGMVAKYFIDLGRAPADGQPISCSGCKSSCHTNIPENPSIEFIRNIKPL